MEEQTIAPISADLVREWLLVHGTEVFRKPIYGFETAKLITPYDGVTDELSLAQMDIVKDLIVEWTGEDDSEDDAIEITDIKLNVRQVETAMTFIFNSKRMRAFNAYLKGANKTTDDMHVLDWLNIPISEKRTNELEDAIWQAKEVAKIPNGKRKLAGMFDGFIEIAKKAVIASKATVVATGAVDNTNAFAKTNMFFKSANKNLRKRGMLIFCSYGYADNYCENRQALANIETKYLPIADTGYTGIQLTLGGGKSYLVPVPGFPDGDGLLGTFKEALAYGFEYESRMMDWKVQERGWKVWVANAFDFGAQILVQHEGYLLINDRLNNA